MGLLFCTTTGQVRESKTNPRLLLIISLYEAELFNLRVQL